MTAGDYTTGAGPTSLDRYVRGYLIADRAPERTVGILTPFTGCVLLLTGSATVRIASRNRTTVRLNSPTLLGPCSHPVRYEITRYSVPTVAVVFTTLGARLLVDSSMDDLVHQAVPAQRFVPVGLLEELVRVAAGVARSSTPIEELDAPLRTHFAVRTASSIGGVAAVVDQLEQRMPSLHCDGTAVLLDPMSFSATAMVQDLEVSERSLRRAFRALTGMGPKQYLSVVRHQQVMRTLLSRPDLSLSTVAFVFGYSDSAHFARDFRSRAMVPPSEFLTSPLHGGARRFSAVGMRATAGQPVA